METLSPQSDLALRYLQDFFPSDWWVLTAIHSDRTGAITRTFGPDTAEEMKTWITEKNLDGHGIYYQVCVTRHKMDATNAQLGDVDKVVYLHVDIDPKGGMDPEQCQGQAIELLKICKDGIPLPTVVVASGGGVQAFWRLNKPIQIGGDIGKAEAAKAHNQRLEVVFDADNCHNINRIMRLPFTINWPNAAKRRKGRVPCLATVVWFRKDLIYDISLFPALQAPQSQFSAIEGQLEIGENIQRVDIDDLDKYEVSDRVKIICVRGLVPDEIKEKDNSRSAWLFDALVKLVKCNVPDAMIYSIITDPDMGISASVLDKRSYDKYARRQILKAKQFAIDPQLVMMNERHAVIRTWGGKCVVVEEIFDPVMERTQLVRTSFADIRNAYCNKFVKVGEGKDGIPKFEALGSWWLKNPLRREYSTLVFAPERDVPDAYNLWRGFGVEAVAGNCQPFLDHIRMNLCSGNQEHYDWLICWMARAVQRPDLPGEVAIVLRGDQGTGKSFFAKAFGALFGRHFLTVSDSKHLIGNFNSHLRDCVLLFGDEAFFAGDKKHESVLKTLITDNMIAIEAKGIDVEATRNYTHMILASNSEWVIPAGAAERRFFVLDVSNDQKQQSDKHGYFDKLATLMETGGGSEALLHYLQSVDLGDWNPRRVPQTEALARQKIYTLDPMQEWWYSKLDMGTQDTDYGYWMEEVECNYLTQDYLDYTRSFGVIRRGNSTQLGRFILRTCPGVTRKQIVRVVEDKDDGFSEMRTERPYVYVFPPLDLCRAYWEEKMGTAYWSITAQEESRKRHDLTD